MNAVSMKDFASESIRGELVDLSERNAGVLTPESVLDRARDEASPLHAYFEWDDTAAAEAYRVCQAAALIRRVKLTVVRAESGVREIHMETVRGFVSPEDERKPGGGGYTAIEKVLSDDERRASLIQTAKRELLAIKKKFETLNELADIWRAVEAL